MCNSRIQKSSASECVLNVRVVVYIDAFDLSDMIWSFNLNFLRSRFLLVFQVFLNSLLSHSILRVYLSSKQILKQFRIDSIFIWFPIDVHFMREFCAKPFIKDLQKSRLSFWIPLWLNLLLLLLNSRKITNDFSEGEAVVNFIFVQKRVIVNEEFWRAAFLVSVTGYLGLHLLLLEWSFAEAFQFVFELLSLLFQEVPGYLGVDQFFVGFLFC